MTTKTNLKAGGHNLNHNEAMKGMAVRTQVQAGRANAGREQQHNETLRGGLKLSTHVKAGKLATNHNESMRSGLATRTSVKAGRRA